MNLTVFLDKATSVGDYGKSMDIFYLDFAKTSDKVPRRRLMEKLQAIGLEKEVVRWTEE